MKLDAEIINLYSFPFFASDNSIVLASPPVGSLGRQKPRSGPSKISPNNMASKSQNYGFATTGRMHRRHSSSDDRLAPGKEEVSRLLIRIVEVSQNNG